MKRGQVILICPLCATRQRAPTQIHPRESFDRAVITNEQTQCAGCRKIVTYGKADLTYEELPMH